MRFHAAFAGGACEPSHLALFKRTVDDVRGFPLFQDVIHVGGVNTVNLLAVWRAQGVDAVLREAWRRGVVLAGRCAGAMCWFEVGVTASFGRALAPLRDGLGLLPGSACPTTAPAAAPTSPPPAGACRPGVGIEDGVALRCAGRRLAAVRPAGARGGRQVGAARDPRGAPSGDRPGARRAPPADPRNAAPGLRATSAGR